MAFDLDHDALHKHVFLALGALPDRVICATQAERVHDLVLRTASRAVRATFFRWNAVRSRLARMPLEVLAACFVHLPLRDRVMASHVCRSWRAAALSYPVVWSRLDLDDSVYRANQALVLKTALTRAGQYPVRLSFRSRDSNRTAADLRTIVGAIEKHMHHISALDWTCETVTPRCFMDAPILEKLVSGSPFTVPIDFLGGKRHALLSLELTGGTRLPPFCPGLSTVTRLTIHDLGHSNNLAGLSNLFHLCPQLQYLKLTNLHSSCAQRLPRGRAPRSLTELSISTQSFDYNLIVHYLAWRTRHLQQVQIGMRYIAGLDLKRLAEGVHTLYFGEDTLTLLFDRPGTICLSFAGYTVREKTATLCNLEPVLQGLRALTIPSTIVDRLASSRAYAKPVLPSLARLTVAIDRGRPRDDSLFGMQRALDEFAQRCPSLEVVVFDLTLLRQYHTLREEYQAKGFDRPYHPLYIDIRAVPVRRRLGLLTASLRLPGGVLSARI